jgi:aspartate/methionine/tyrosine aminotransferase
MKFDLAWGNSVAVREAFLNTYHGNPMVLAREELATYDYPTHEGDPALVEVTRQVIKRQTDQEYKHVFLTNGATGGVVIALRAYAQKGMEFCMTREAPYYGRYPSMIAATGLKQIEENPRYPINTTVILLDLPSNPLGMISQIGPRGLATVIDGVYMNRVYSQIMYGLPQHDAMVGSYSKLLGINGIRVGWLATNDDILAERFRDLVTAEYCGLSTASTDILLHTLQGLNWDRFEQYAKLKLDCNREEWVELERFFGGMPVPANGMFYYGPMDKKAQEIFEKAGIIWTKGSTMGTDDGFARFNLGQNNELIENAVKAVLKEDRI